MENIYKNYHKYYEIYKFLHKNGCFDLPKLFELRKYVKNETHFIDD